MISGGGCSIFIGFLHYFPNNLSNFAWRRPTKTRTQSHDNGEDDGACATRFSVSHSLSSAFAHQHTIHQTPNTTHTIRIRLRNEGSNTRPQRPRVRSKLNPAVRGTLHIRAPIGPPWNRLCTEKKYFESKKIRVRFRRRKTY